MLLNKILRQKIKLKNLKQIIKALPNIRFSRRRHPLVTPLNTSIDRKEKVLAQQTKIRNLRREKQTVKKAHRVLQQIHHQRVKVQNEQSRNRPQQ